MGSNILYKEGQPPQDTTAVQDLSKNATDAILKPLL